MSNTIVVRMEVRGDAKAVKEFGQINWQLEASGKGKGLLEGVSDVGWQLWERHLEMELVSGYPVYHWGTKRPDRFLCSLAQKFPNLTFIVSLWDECDNDVGSAVLRDTEILSSFEEDPYGAIGEGPNAPRARYDVMYKHYKNVLKEAGLQTVTDDDLDVTQGQTEDSETT